MKEFVFKYKFLFIIFFVVIFLLIIFNKKSSDLSVISGNSIFINKDGNWDCSFPSNKMKGYYVYSGDEFVGKYNLKYDKYWTYGNDFSFDSEFFALSDNKKIKLITSQMLFDDGNLDLILYSYLSSKGLYDYGNVYQKKYYDYDLDGDGALEKIIQATNYDTDSMVNSLFSTVFIYDNGAFYDVKYYSVFDLSLLPICSVANIFSVNSLNNIIVDCSYFSNHDSFENSLYNYSNNEVSELSMCSKK